MATTEWEMRCKRLWLAALLAPTIVERDQLVRRYRSTPRVWLWWLALGRPRRVWGLRGYNARVRADAAAKVLRERAGR